MLILRSCLGDGPAPTAPVADCGDEPDLIVWGGRAYLVRLATDNPFNQADTPILLSTIPLGRPLKTGRDVLTMR